MTQAIYEALLNSNAVVEFDVQGQILWANKNFLDLLGYTLPEIVGQHHSVFLPDYSLHEAEYSDIWSRITTGYSHVGEFKRLTKDRRTIWIQGSYTAVRNAADEIVKIVKMAVDITEKKSLAEHLERKNRELATTAAKAKAATTAKSVFLANMSHEIRTPLNSIIGITDTLAETPLDDQQASFVGILQKANNQLMTIINDILDLSKVEAGEVELNPQPFELKKIVDDLVDVLGFRAKEKGLQLTVEIEPELQTLFLGDADRLRQVLLNLLNNAIKFTKQGSISIKIAHNSTAHSGNLLFTVADSGIGIPKSKFKDIFQPFTQADSTTTRRHGGTGLGLSITKNLVELMNGEIWLESKIDSGSIFYFTVDMPVTEMPSISGSHSIFPFTDFRQNFLKSRLNILIVDDVEDNRNLFGIYLQNTIHKLSFAESGSEALNMVQKEHFDIIFMDVQMPGMDGYETTRNIRDLERHNGRPGARIFACTANAFAEDIARSLKAGCDLHLSKPIRKDTLLKAINSTLPPGDSIC